MPVMDADALIGETSVLYDEPTVLWSEQLAADLISTFNDPQFGWSHENIVGESSVRFLASDNLTDNTQGIYVRTRDGGELLLLTRPDYPFVVRLIKPSSTPLREDVANALNGMLADLPRDSEQTL